MEAYSVIRGGRRYDKGFGQIYHHAAPHPAAVSVNSTDIEKEVAERGYVIQTVTHHAPVVTQPEPAPLSKSAAIKIAVDMGINQLQLPHTDTHPYRCPTGTCPLTPTYYNLLISWSVTTANGLLTGKYTIPVWAQGMLHEGTLRGLGYGGHLSGWIQDNPWVVQSVGDVLTNYGEFLTAQNVQEAIKAVEQNTKGSLSKDDIPALVAALTQGGYIDPKATPAVAAGAEAAATPSWMMPAMLIGGALLIFTMLRK
jgi:hypothetical protein